MARLPRRLSTPIAAALAAASFPAAAAAAPSVSFDFSPASPLSGEPVEFSSTSTGITKETWDLDDDGDCDDGTGATITRAFPTPDPYDITLCVEGTGVRARLTQTVTVRNRPPAASFVYSPAAPMVGQTISLTSLSTDADSAIVRQAWDLDGDTQYDDGIGIIAALPLPLPGVRRVGLRVTDREGASTTTVRDISVVKPPPEPLAPFPIVRMFGRLTRTGAAIRYFAVRAPGGSDVTVRCRARRCPYRRKTVTAGSKALRFRRLERRLRAGTVIEVFVTKDDAIGKYTRFRIRRGREPGRVDGCLFPGEPKPGSCRAG